MKEALAHDDTIKYSAVIRLIQIIVHSGVRTYGVGLDTASWRTIATLRQQTVMNYVTKADSYYM